MKKEYFLIFSISLLVLAYVIDYISGPVSIVIKNPYLFLNQTAISLVPLTAVGIFSRSLGLLVGIILILSLISKKFFLKAITSFFLAVFFNLFAIQQLATNTRTVTIQWSLSLAFAGLALIVPIIFYLIKGSFHSLTSKVIIPHPTENDQKESPIED